MRILYLLVIASACGSTPPPPSREGSRGLRADEHLDAAQQHARRAAGLAQWLDARRGPDATIKDRDGLWYRAWQMSKEDEREIVRHRSEAAQLRAHYEQACEGIPASDVSVSPISRHGVGWIRTPEGVTLLLSTDAGPADRLVAEMRCHRAWLMLGEGEMKDCALDLAGLDVVAYGDRSGITVELSVEDPALVRELQRRASRELERADHGTTGPSGGL